MTSFKWLSILFVLSLTILTIPVLSMTESITEENYTAVTCDPYWWQDAQLHQVKGLSENFTLDQIINTFCGEEENSPFHLAAQANPYPEVIEYLFDIGFYIEDENLLGQNVFALATMNENPEILHTLNILNGNNEDSTIRHNTNNDVDQPVFKSTQGFRGPSNEAKNRRQRENVNWYRGIAMGTNLLLQAKQEGWNRDTFCYPDEDCSNTPPVSGYRWSYDIGPEEFPKAIEFFIGADHGETRWDITLSHQRNNIHQTFTGSNSYTDPDLTEPIIPMISDKISTNVITEVGNMTLNSAALNGYYEFFQSPNVTIYGGGGLGIAHTAISDLRFSVEYYDNNNKSKELFPPLSFYNSSQDIDISGWLPFFQIHAGIDFPIRDNKSLGFKLSYSRLDNLAEHEGHYTTHPMHSIDPNFPNYTTFKDIQFLTAMMVFKWR